MNYTNKTIIVTGGLKGIGGATSQLFLEKGANVVVLDVDGNDLNDNNDKRRLFIKCDVSDEAQVKNAVAQGIEKFGTIHYLINNAGIQHYGKVADTSLDDWNKVMRINVTSMFLCAKYVLPEMEENKYGVIVNLSSVQAYVSQDKVAAYSTSKTAIVGLTRSIAIDYAPHIRSVAICPGTVDTPLVRNAAQLSPDPDAVIQECMDMHLLKRIAKPEEIAALIVFVCGDDAAFITGQSIRIDGGLGIKIEGSKKD